MSSSPRESQSLFVKVWKRLSGDWHFLQDVPLSPEEIRGVFSQTSLPIFHYYLLLIAATVISTLGLLTNSAATIIGGMLIAPLMGPVMTLGFATISFERKLIRRSLFAVGTGMALVVLIAGLISVFLGLRLANPEILSRTRPNLLDLGVAVAAGAAGAFAFARPKVANAVPGVAIAVALVPPLCVFGIALSSLSIGQPLVHHNWENEGMAEGAFLLFFTNVLGIMFSAGVVFLLHGYGQIQKGIKGMAGVAVILLLVAWPLDLSFRELHAKASVSRQIAELRETRPDLFGMDRVLYNDISYRDGAYHIDADVVVVDETLPGIEKRIGQLSKELSQRLDKVVRLKVTVLRADFFEISHEE